MSTLRYSLPVTALFFSTLQVSAHAASMQKVEQSAWLQGATGLPSYVNMYVYVPDQLADVPPIVVAPHHCQGTASSTNSEMASLRAVADTTGFIMIMPEATGQNCWDAGSTRSLKHGGGGDTGAIVVHRAQAAPPALAWRERHHDQLQGRARGHQRMDERS